MSGQETVLPPYISSAFVSIRQCAFYRLIQFAVFLQVNMKTTFRAFALAGLAFVFPAQAVDMNVVSGPSQPDDSDLDR